MTQALTVSGKQSVSLQTVGRHLHFQKNKKMNSASLASSANSTSSLSIKQPNGRSTALQTSQKRQVLRFVPAEPGSESKAVHEGNRLRKERDINRGEGSTSNTLGSFGQIGLGALSVLGIFFANLLGRKLSYA